MVSDAVANGNVQALNYFVAQKYVEALQAIASARNQKVVLMPLEASSVIGAVAGIAEIARESFGNSGNSPATTSRRRSSVPVTGRTTGDSEE